MLESGSPPPTTSTSHGQGLAHPMARSTWPTSSASTPRCHRELALREFKEPSNAPHRCGPHGRAGCSAASPAAASTTTRPSAVPEHESPSTAGSSGCRRRVHGFTQMDAYATNSPLVIDRAEGRELIDVVAAATSMRSRPSGSTRWASGPELDAALIAQASKVAHSTMLATATRRVELAEALQKSCRSTPPLPFRRRRGRGRRAGPEDRPSVLGQSWRRGRTQYLAWRRLSRRHHRLVVAR